MINILTIIAALSNLLLGIIVIYKNHKKPLYFYFFLFSFLTFIWVLLNYIFSINHDISILRLQYATGGAIIPLFLIWFEHLLNKKPSKIFIALMFGFVLFLLILPQISGLIISSLTFDYQTNNFVMHTGVLFDYFSILVLLLFGYLFLKLIVGVKNNYGIKRTQLKYILIGAILYGGISMLMSFILPFFNIKLVAPIDAQSSLFFVGFSAYSISRYRLMDIRLIITKSILYFILVVVVASTFTFVTFSTGQFFEGKGELWITLLVSLIIVIGIDPLKKLLANLTDKFFYKGKIDYQEVSKMVSQEIAGELDMEDLLNNLAINLQKELKLKNVRLFLQNIDNGSFHSYQKEGVADLEADGPLIKYFRTNKEIVVVEELIRQKNDSKNQEEIQMLEIVEKRLEELKSALAVPVFSKDKLTSLLLVEDKLSGGTFSQADLDFFSVLAPQIAVALEKSKLFEEVQSAKINLEHLVEQRTRDLKDRNRYLLALQRLINLTTRSLDFQKVMQTIADGISTELGFIGGMLNFIDFQRGYIGVKAISNTPEIMEVQKLVTRSPELYNISLREENNLAVKAILQKEIIKGERFADFLAPAIDKATADKMQMVLGIKTILAVPIYSEEKVIGVIDFVLAENIDNIKDVEKEMMKSLADQVGIVYRNLSLYNQINLANQDLKQANVRLTQLDKSKSEFLSIASHQLRTPLTGIKGYLSMIIAGDFGAVPAKVMKVLNDVFMNTDRLTRLINIFLNVSRIESGRFEITKQEIDLTALIVEVIDAMKPSAEQKQVALAFHRPDQLLPNIPVDRDKIKDVLLNLVDNAIKYTPKGSIDVSAVSLGDALQVTIKDTGIGIAEGEDRELFKKFVRGDGVAQINTGGSGLGLFIAKKIVEAHSGKIWVESAGKNMGSSFIFTLPKK